MTAKRFTWLHLTDLHVGQPSSGWLWPNFKTLFFDDVRRLIGTVEGIDVVIFSGDLTQKGSPLVYETLTGILGDLWELFDKHGKVPVLFPVPGNHDLLRPAPDAQETLLLKQWHAVPAVSKAFWNTNENPYLGHVRTAFKNYTDWVNSPKIAEYLPDPWLIALEWRW